MTEQIIQDVQAHAKTITELVTELNKLRTDREKNDALRLMKDEYLDERLDRIEASIKSVYGLGKWVLGAFGAVLLSAAATFIVRGGLFGP